MVGRYDTNLVGGDVYLSDVSNGEKNALEKFAFSNAMALSGICICIVSLRFLGFENPASSHGVAWRNDVQNENC